MRRQREHDLQTACVRWFRYRHPRLARCLIAVPNGGRRDAVTGAKLKAEGVTAGVSDLLLLVPRGCFHGLCIEMKTPQGRQSEAQRDWQLEMEIQGYKYALVRSSARSRHSWRRWTATSPRHREKPGHRICFHSS